MDFPCWDYPVDLGPCLLIGVIWVVTAAWIFINALIWGVFWAVIAVVIWGFVMVALGIIAYMEYD
jgi:hypothetical protein